MEKLEIVFHKLYCLRARWDDEFKGKGAWGGGDAGKRYMPLDLLSCTAEFVKSSLKDSDMTRWDVVCWTDSEQNSVVGFRRR